MRRRSRRALEAGGPVMFGPAGELLGSTGRTGRIETGTSNSTGVDIQLSGLVVE